MFEYFNISRPGVQCTESHNKIKEKEREICDTRTECNVGGPRSFQSSEFGEKWEKEKNKEILNIQIIGDKMSIMY